MCSETRRKRMTEKKPKADKTKVEEAASRLEPGEAHPTEGEDRQFKEEDLRFFFDENGKLTSMGTVDDTFHIRHDETWLVLDVDSVDIDFLRESLSSPTIDAWMRQLAKDSPKLTKFIKEGYENSFLLLVKASPQLTDRPSPRQFYLLRLLQEIMTQEEFEEISKKCTLNVTRSTLVAKEWMDSIAKILDEDDLQVIEDMEHLDQQFRGVMGDMQDFLKRSACAKAVAGGVDAMGRAQASEAGEAGEGDEFQVCKDCGQRHPAMRPPTPKELGLTADQARERLRKLAEEFGKLRKKILQKMEENKERIESVARSFASAGAAQGKEQMDRLSSLSLAAGTEEGELKQIDMESILKVAERYRNSPDMQLLIKELGRMRRIALKTMHSMTKEVENTQNKPVELDDNISRMIPNEMVKSRHPGLKKEFRKRLLEKQIECFDTKGPQPSNRGPVLICKDTSGSMHGAPNAWATALGLTTGFVATSQGRRYALINFSSRGQLKVSEFEKRTPFPDQIEEASFMFNGGTCFETPLGKCEEMIQEAAYDEADVLFLTDGICHVSDEFLKSFLKTKAERHFKVITVLINVGYGDLEVVDSFSDKVFLLSDLQEDSDVLETAFSL